MASQGSRRSPFKMGGTAPGTDSWNVSPPKSSALQWHQVPPLEDLLVLLGRLDVEDSGASAARPQGVIMRFDTKRAIMHPKAIVMLVHRV